MIATDPLSLVFLACLVFSGVFLIVSLVSGVGHGVHLGVHVAHAAHLVHSGPAGHLAQASHVAHTAHTTHMGHAAHQGQIEHAAHASAPPASAQTASPSNGGNVSSGNSAPAVSAQAAPSPLAALEHAFLGSLNLYSILVFLLVFSLLGYLLHNATNLGDVLSIVIALLVGDGCAVALGLLLTRLFVSETPHELTSESSRLEGRLGRVSMAIRGDGVGEVIFPGAAGGRQSVGARGLDGEAIPMDAEVVIVSYEDGIATVQQWDAFIAGLRAGTSPELAPINLPG